MTKLYAWYKMNQYKTIASGSKHIINMLTQMSIWHLNHKYYITFKLIENPDHFDYHFINEKYEPMDREHIKRIVIADEHIV